ncbi:MAG: DUF952 domain-containing protein [Rhodomicrobium sp.]
MPARIIYKLMPRTEWEAAQAEGVYRGSAHDKRDGFIHFSTAAQLAGTARKHFAGVSDLVLLAVDIASLSWPPSEAAVHSAGLNAAEEELDGRVKPGHDKKGDALRWEPSRGGDLFPHLYADLPIAAVKSAAPVPLAEDGTPILPAGLAL